VNNLPKVVTRQCPGVESNLRPSDLRITSPARYCQTTEPHIALSCILGSILLISCLHILLCTMELQQFVLLTPAVLNSAKCWQFIGGISQSFSRVHAVGPLTIFSALLLI